MSKVTSAIKPTRRKVRNLTLLAVVAVLATAVYNGVRNSDSEDDSTAGATEG